MSLTDNYIHFTGLAQMVRKSSVLAAVASKKPLAGLETGTLVAIVAPRVHRGHQQVIAPLLHSSKSCSVQFRKKRP